jgi:hypothetical protein
MVHTYRALAYLLTAAMLATIGVGFWSFFITEIGDYKKNVFLIHFSLGLVTALGLLLAHCLVFTYFLGTGRWVKEVTLAYRLPDEPWHRDTRELKRQTFPPALFSMLIAIATTAAGAGAQLQAWHWTVHATLAFLTLAINLWAFRLEMRNLARNNAVIQGVLDEVDRVRAAQGLTSNDEALKEEEEAAGKPK